MIKNMKSKMTTNSQLSTIEPKNKDKNKNKLSKQLEPQKWRSHEGLSTQRGKGENGEKVQGIRSTNDR